MAVIALLAASVILAGAGYLSIQQGATLGPTTPQTATAGSHPGTTQPKASTSNHRLVEVLIPADNGERGSDGTEQFNPQVVTVVNRANNAVARLNLDQIPHVLTASGFSSGDISTGQA